MFGPYIRLSPEYYLGRQQKPGRTSWALFYIFRLWANPSRKAAFLGFARFAKYCYTGIQQKKPEYTGLQ